ncbi:PqiB family protein [Shewanella gelidii]|uniref:Multivalent adhesion molecule 7 n=1 Tax=Shewanella gelidii TaxID=1642821 RepID=A0A917NCE3_9GAMM|nr:MlaD family protein [Shewanella gelidii]MCL1099028.1 MlaD family protein [Shewanella gelidii]GGI88715.1 multivalent adhesion molecule 7 [Shewanella gelidii]
MTETEAPKVVKKKLFSPIWLLPIVALALGSWLGIKSIKESGIEVSVHFPSATGIDVGKTLVKYQGLTVGKVVDIGLDQDLSGVNVDILMDYRAEPFLTTGTKFWLVTPKASITGVEGLDALFSGNYIGVQPGQGDTNYSFEAEKQAPAITPGSEGVVLELTAEKLGSIDVGSPVFYRQIPVGNIVSYRLTNHQTVTINAFVQEQYAYLVKHNSSFWNVSGVSIDASLQGIKVNSESLASIIAGGITFNSPQSGEPAKNGDSFTLYQNETNALGGIRITLAADTAANVSKGTNIEYRGLKIGQILQSQLTPSGVIFDAKIDTQYQSMLNQETLFWSEGADISLGGVKNAARMITGHVINIIPGRGAPQTAFELNDVAPDLLQADRLQLTLTSDANPGVQAGSQVRYKQIPIGEVTSANLSESFEHVEYAIEIWPEFAKLIAPSSYFVAESALAVDASLDGVSIKSRDIDTLVKGAISLMAAKPYKPVNQVSSNKVTPKTKQTKLIKPLRLFSDRNAAQQYFAKQKLIYRSLSSLDGAGLSEGSPVYFKKMKVGAVTSVNWATQTNQFTIELGIKKQFQTLLNPRTVFWRNGAATINASLAGVDIDVAPLEGTLKGSISLGHVDAKQNNTEHLYADKKLALMQAKPISIQLPAAAQIAVNAAIRYQGHQVGQVKNVSLDPSLNFVNADAYLYGDYAKYFVKSDSQFFIVQAQVSLAGVKDVDTLITGPYIGVLPGKSAQQQFRFNASLTAPMHTKQGDLLVQLEDSELGSVKVGTQIFYRGIAIGQVDQVQLAASGNKIIMHAHIDSQYRHVVNQSSKFWDLSGIKLDWGLFSGAQINTGSLETLLVGGIGVATRETTNTSNQIRQQLVAPLHEKPDPLWQQWAPKQSIRP